MKKRLLVLLLSFCMLLAFAGCGAEEDEDNGRDRKRDSSESKDAEEDDDDDEDVKEADADDKEDEAEQGDPALASQAGYYTLYEYEANGIKVDHDMLVTAGMGDTYLDLKADGTGKFRLFESDLDITWEENKITVYGTSDYDFEINGDTLVMDMQGVYYTMKKGDGSAPADTSVAAADDKDEEDTPDATDKKDDEPAKPAADAPGGDGIVSEEMVQKGYVWMNKINKDIFNATYEDLVAYFGTEGAFDKEEFSEHMNQNRRYYKWISSENDTHFVYVNLGEKDPEGAPGVYKVTGFNSSGFTSADAEAKYLDVLQQEASDADKAAAGSAKMKDVELSIAPFGKDDKAMKVKVSMPESGWSINEKKSELVDNDDPEAFGAGFIKFKMEEDIEKFDFYKDSFENYKDIDEREIGGIKMKGRTYKNIGYEWTEYIAQISDGKAVSVGIVRVDISDGTMGDKILNSISFK